MAPKSSIPEEIRKYAPCKCCRIRRDPGDVYRVYKYNSVKLPSGKWSNNYGYLIGKILPEEGFIPNKRYLAELGRQEEIPSSEGITDVAYGQYALLLFLSKDILEKLETQFPHERAMQIYSYAMILCANGFLRIDQIDDYYQESFLSVLYRQDSFRMGEANLHELLRDLGMHGNPVRAFEQFLIDNCSGKVVIEGYVLRSGPDEIDFVGPEDRMYAYESPLVNLLVAYDAKNKMPLLLRTDGEFDYGKNGLLEALESRSFSNTTFLVDGDFFSRNALEFMSRNDNCYIIPALLNAEEFARCKQMLALTSEEFLYHSDLHDCARILFCEKQIGQSTRMIAYRDVDDYNAKRKDYQKQISLGETGYSQAIYDRVSDWWGTCFLLTNSEESVEEVYSNFKNGLPIELFEDCIKNIYLNDREMQDYYVRQGFCFILLVTGLIHARLNEAVGVLIGSKLSAFDILVKAGHMRMVYEGDEWRLRNARTEDLNLLKIMGFIPQRTYSDSIKRS